MLGMLLVIDYFSSISIDILSSFSSSKSYLHIGKRKIDQDWSKKAFMFKKFTETDLYSVPLTQKPEIDLWSIFLQVHIIAMRLSLFILRFDIFSVSS